MQKPCLIRQDVSSFSFVVFSQSCLTLWPHGLQHARLLFPSLFPRVCSNSCPWSQWYHPTISPPPPAFNFSQYWGLFQWVNSSHPVPKVLELVSASVFPMNIQGWFPLGLTGLISLLSKRLLRVFSSATVQRHQFFSSQPFLLPSSHIHTWLLEKP